MKFDFPDINETLAEESSLVIQNQQEEQQQQSSTGTLSPLYSVTPTPTWSNREVVDVLEAIRLHGPNFFLIAGKVPSKNVNQIRKFYFLNKRRYNLDRMDRMDRNSSSMDEGCPGTGEKVKERVGGGGATAKKTDSLVGPAEYNSVVSSSSFIGADCGDSIFNAGLPSDDDTPIIPPEPRPFRQARTKQAGKYVEKTKNVSSEEEDVVESEEEKKSVSDDESSDPNFEGEEEEGEVSDESDTEQYGKGRKKKNNHGRMLGSSSGTACNFEAMKGTPFVASTLGATFPRITMAATPTTTTTATPGLFSPSATVAPLPTTSTTSLSSITVSAVGTQPASSFVEGLSTSASPSSPSRRLVVVMKQLPDGFSYGFHHNATPANSSSASSTALVQKESHIMPSSRGTAEIAFLKMSS